MIVVTGAAGFIGSCLVNKLNNKGYTDIVVVDDFTNPNKNLNLSNKIFRHRGRPGGVSGMAARESPPGQFNFSYGRPHRHH